MAMGTLVTIHLTAAGGDAAIDRGFAWFRTIESCCTRFDQQSELMQLCGRPGTAVHVSQILFEAVRFAVTVAHDTGGAFDPTVGGRMARRGFDREYRSGHRVAAGGDDDASYRDIGLDEAQQTITLGRAMTLDLGGVAKGLAVDAAARELRDYTDFVVDAGGDLFLGGRSPRGTPWSVGIPHPRVAGELIETITVSDHAVCTSGDYERATPHLIDPRSDAAATACASVTVIAPNAMLADALATAAFVLGPEDGARLLERHGVEGVIFTPDLVRHATAGFPRG
jgi:thiamine biosynthesis lipoprotein